MSAISRDTIETALEGGDVVLEAETNNLAVTTSEVDLTARIHFKRTEETETVPIRELDDLIEQLKDRGATQ